MDHGVYLLHWFLTKLQTVEQLKVEFAEYRRWSGASKILTLLSVVCCMSCKLCKHQFSSTLRSI